MWETTGSTRLDVAGVTHREDQVSEVLGWSGGLWRVAQRTLAEGLAFGKKSALLKLADSV